MKRNLLAVLLAATVVAGPSAGTLTAFAEETEITLSDGAEETEDCVLCGCGRHFG